MCALAEFRNLVSDSVFGSMVQGIFMATSGQTISKNVLLEAAAVRTK